MKKVLLALLLPCLTIVSVRADLIWYEDFNYPDGPIISNAPPLWVRFSGSASPSDMLVKNHRLEVSATGGTLSRQDDCYRRLCTTGGCSYTNGLQVLYASFTVNCTNLPNAAGSYFASFYGTSPGYFGRIWAMTTNTVVPNTWRLGISGNSGSVSKIYPVDLATNTEYQVVAQWDPVNLYAITLWVNPINSGDSSVTSSDTIAAPGLVNTFAFRQASSFGNAFFAITNLAVATTFDEAATNVWTTNAVASIIAIQPKGNSTFAYNTFSISAVAAGQGLGNMTYQWVLNGTQFLNNPLGNTNVWTFNAAQPGDSGDYQLIATTPYGLSATSAVATVVVTNSNIRPIIVQQPASNTVAYTHGTVTLTVAAIGPPTLGYTWYYKNATPITNENVTISGDGTSLTITDIITNNAGTYRCDVANGNGSTTGSNAVVVVTNPPVVTIGYLRTLVDTNFFLPTNTTAHWTSTGTVISKTNLTAVTSAKFFISDGTNGIAVFVGGSTTIRPQLGDSVTVTGPLGQYQSLLEFNLSASDPSHIVVTNSSGNPLPRSYVLPLSFTNGIGFGGVGAALQKYGGSLVTFTNVLLPGGGGANTFPSGTYAIRNAQGDSLIGYTHYTWTDIIGQPMPASAFAVTCLLDFYLDSTATNRSSGYELDTTDPADFVTTPPSITLDTPADGSSALAPASLPLAATVTSNNFPISYVGFYNGTTLLANVTNPPYSYSWSGVAAGGYALSAKVAFPIYGNTLSVGSATNNVTVTNPPPPSVSGISVSGGDATITGTTTANRELITEQATSLTTPISWIPVKTSNAAPDGSFSISIPVGTNSEAYFRIKGL